MTDKIAILICICSLMLMSGCNRHPLGALLTEKGFNDRPFIQISDGRVVKNVNSARMDFYSVARTAERVGQVGCSPAYTITLFSGRFTEDQVLHLSVCDSFMGTVRHKNRDVLNFRSPELYQFAKEHFEKSDIIVKLLSAK
jgi:hypothetical protein